MKTEELTSIIEQLSQSMQKHEARMEIMIQDAELRFSKFAHHVDGDLLKDSVKQGYLELNQVMSETSKQIVKRNQHKWWQKFLVGFIGAIVGVLATNLYLNNETPWELHHRVMEERLIGAAVVKNWDQLSSVDRHKILDTLDKKSQQEIFHDLHLKFSRSDS